MQAARHKRSLNQEVIALLEEQTAPSRRVKAEAIIAKAKRFRDSLHMVAIPEDIDRFKRQGRP
jgi:plasmid stability protein